jgi:aminocarboxymuconate-semialdehyde decarboxylase
MIVDCHAHLVPPDLLAEIRKQRARFPSVHQIEEGGGLAFAFAGAKPTRPVSKPLSDIPGRVAWMQKQAIDRQVVGGWVDMFGYELPGAEGEAWSRLGNDALLATAKAEPRFVPLATVPLGNGARGGRAERCG